MHYTALACANCFSEMYGGKDKIVVDIGGRAESTQFLPFRRLFEDKGMKYICVDLDDYPSVDVVIKPGDKLPFDTGSVDIVVSSSCFEHDPCFWMTFRELSRILKPNGYVYVNAPTNGPYHKYPGDNWRFYSDAGQALAYWSSYKLSEYDSYHMKVVETFHIVPKNDVWMDFVCVWQRTDEEQTEIIVSELISQNIGLLQNKLHQNNFETVNKC
jgi:SAM-dependent methyltransferase